MHTLSMDAAALAQWPTVERLRALKRIIPRAQVQAVLRRTGHAAPENRSSREGMRHAPQPLLPISEEQG